MRYLLTLAVCTLLLPACSLLDDGYTSVRGRVVDADTREPVAAALEIRRNTLFGEYPLATASAGADGRFAFEFKDTPALTTTYLSVEPTRTDAAPSQDGFPSYSATFVENLHGGDLGDIEVQAISQLTVRTSRLLTDAEVLRLSVTATRDYQGVEDEVISEGTYQPSTGKVRTDRVRAGTRVVVQWQLRTRARAPVASGQVETVAARGATEVVLALP